MKIQQWANKQKLVESWSYNVWLKDQACKRLSQELRKACLFLSNPTCFSLTYQLKSFCWICHKLRESSCHFTWRNGLIATWMFPLFILQKRQWYWTWKAFLSINNNYFYQHQNIPIISKGESETCPISEIAIIILSLTDSLSVHLKLPCYLFLICFSCLAALVCFVAVFPFVAFPILLQQLQEKNKQQKNSICLERNVKH